MNNKELAQWIKKLNAEGKLYTFYKSHDWQKLRAKVLRDAHNECEWCKEQGKISKAVTVHHVQFVKSHPELALSEYYTYQGKQYKNLIALCHQCHDKAHDRLNYGKAKEVKPLTEERW